MLFLIKLFYLSWKYLLQALCLLILLSRTTHANAIMKGRDQQGNPPQCLEEDFQMHLQELGAEDMLLFSKTTLYILWKISSLNVKSYWAPLDYSCAQRSACAQVLCWICVSVISTLQNCGISWKASFHWVKSIICLWKTCSLLKCCKFFAVKRDVASKDPFHRSHHTQTFCKNRTRFELAVKCNHMLRLCALEM